MAFERNPNERPDPEPMRRPSRLEEDLQADPEMMEGRASNGRIALFAAAIIVILAVVFYGLNNSEITPSQPTSTAQQQQQPAPSANQPQPAPRAGETTGSATSSPEPPGPPANAPGAAPPPNAATAPSDAGNAQPGPTSPAR